MFNLPIQKSPSINPSMNSDMSSQMSTTPSFFIYRSAPSNGDSFDPAAAFQFYPPKDSDELFDALRAAYPNAKTLSERMRDAVIDFLLNERGQEQARSNMASTPSTWSFPSSSSSSSNFSSPDLIDLATPVSATSPLPTMSRQPSRSSAGRSSMEQMTGVFSLSANSQPKTRVRRKMTESEKAEYRKRRLVKACEKCSKRKRKCHHNQDQMETVTSSGKVAKRKSPSTNVSSFRHIERTPPPSSAFTSDLDPLSFLTDDALLTLSNDTEQASATESTLSLMDFDFNPQTVNTGAWPWSDTQDWTLMDNQPTHYPAHSEPLFGELSGFGNQYHQPQQRQLNSSIDGFGTESFAPTQLQPAIHTWNTHSPMSAGQSSQFLTNVPTDLLGDDVLHTHGALISPDSFVSVDHNNATQATRNTHTARQGLATASNSSASNDKGKARVPSSSQSALWDSLDVPRSDLQLLSRKTADPLRSVDTRSAVTDRATDALSGIFHNEENHCIGLQSSVMNDPISRNNTSPERIASASAGLAGLSDNYTRDPAPIRTAQHSEANSPFDKFAPRKPKQKLAAGLSAAEHLLASSSTGFGRNARVSPALARGLDSGIASANTSHVASAARTSGDATVAHTYDYATLQPTGANSTSSKGHSPILSARPAGSMSTRTRIAAQSGETSTASGFMNTSINRPQGQISLQLNAASLLPSLSQASRASALPNAASPSESHTSASAAYSMDRVQLKASTGWTGNAPRNTYKENAQTVGKARQAAETRAELQPVPVPSLLQSASHSTGGIARTASSDTAARTPTTTTAKTSVNGSLVSSHSSAPGLHRSIPAPAASSLASRVSTSASSNDTPLAAAVDAARVQQLPLATSIKDNASNNSGKKKHGRQIPDGHTHAEAHPSPLLRSGAWSTDSKSSLVASKQLSNCQLDSVATTTTLSRCPTDVQAALMAVSIVSSGYLLGLASALTGELLKSMKEKESWSISSGRSGMTRGGVRAMSTLVTCV